MLALQSEAGRKVYTSRLVPVGCGSSLIDTFKFVVRCEGRRGLCVLFFAFSAFPHVSVSSEEDTPKKDVRRIEKRQVEGPENATCLLEWDTIW
jgi:hypothetical protein